MAFLSAMHRKNIAMHEYDAWMAIQNQTILPFSPEGNDEDAQKKSAENISSWPGWLIGVTVFAVILFLVTMIGLGRRRLRRAQGWQGRTKGVKSKSVNVVNPFNSAIDVEMREVPLAPPSKKKKKRRNSRERSSTCDADAQTAVAMKM